MKNNYKIYASIFLMTSSFIILFSNHRILAQYDLSSQLKGKILLAVEDHGEAWYVSPLNLKKYYLGRPDDAFSIMRSLSLGVTNESLKKIPVAEANFSGLDTDGDGLSDAVETGFGTDPKKNDTDGDGYNDKEEVLSGFDPNGPNRLATNVELVNKMSGYILLQVESKGEAWYVNPSNKKRYYLGRPSHAFNLMKSLGLGISNANLAKVDSYDENPDFSIKNLVAKYTETSSTNNDNRLYLDSKYSLSLEYPKSWTLKKGAHDNITQFTDANVDYILEKKGVITLNFLKTPEIEDVSVFKLAAKGEDKAITDEKKIINSKDAYENSYEHLLASERTTTIKIDGTDFLQITLATAKNNDTYYNQVYDDLINSISFK